MKVEFPYRPQNTIIILKNLWSKRYTLQTLAPNMHIKMPATSAGIKAFEEATYRGVSINATVSFSATQAQAVGEAVQRGLDRRTAEGLG